MKNIKTYIPTLKEQDDKFYVFKDAKIGFNCPTDEIENNSIGYFIGGNWVKLEPPVKQIKTNVFDVAAYVLSKTGAVTTIKLQKLIYYCQVWSLVWDDKPLFNEKIEAWVNGPVVKELYIHHKGFYEIDSISIGNPDKLSANQKNTVDSVLEFYKDKPTSWLVELSHNEKPWQIARRGLGSLERGNKEITLESIMDYYTSL